MMKAESKLIYGLLALMLVPAAGCFNASGEGGSDNPNDPKMIGQGQGVVMVYSDVMNNPIPPNATAAATAWDMGGTMRLTLAVAGFPASRDFGAHLHKDPCDPPNKAGGHYQHNVAPMAEVSTPAYANTTNEAWLDFTTKADGTASAETTQPWVPRVGGAKAIIIHAMRTDVNGKAGDKLACLPMVLP